MNLKNVRVHEENEDHFVVSHGDDRPFKVAKRGLEKSTLDKIQSHHAMQHLDAGGGVVDATGLSPEVTRDQQAFLDSQSDSLVNRLKAADIESANRQMAPVLAYEAGQRQPWNKYALPTKEQDEKAREARELELPVTVGYGPPPSQEPKAPASPAATQPSSPPIPAQSGPSETQPTAPQFQMPNLSAGMGGGDLEREVASAGKAKSQAELDSAKVAMQKGLEEQKFYQDQSTQLQARMKQRDADFADNLRRTDQISQDIASGKVDPNQYLNNRSTGEKFRGAIAMILGGIGGGMTHTENPVLKMLDDAINRDVDAQKSNLENRRSQLSYYMQRGHSIQEAGELAKADLKDIASSMHMGMAAKFSGPEAAAAAQQMAAQTRMDTVKTRAQIREAGQAADLKRMELLQKKMELAFTMNARPAQMAAESGEVVPEPYGALLDAKRRVKVPGGWALANTDKDRDEAADTTQAYASATGAIKRIRDLSSTTGLGGTDTQRGQAALVDLQNAYQSILGRSNAPRGEQEKQLEAAFSNPTSIWRSREGIGKQMDLAQDIINKHAIAVHGARLIGGIKAAKGLQVLPGKQ